MKNFNTQKWLPVAAVCASGLWSATCVLAQPQQTNIGMGKAAVFTTPPNYALCSDPDDNKQLTDGLYSSQGKLQETQNTTAIWVQKGTVGWTQVKPVVIAIDLGSVQPISGVSYSTAARVPDVKWPLSIYMTVSDDNVTWRSAGDLVLFSRKNVVPPTEGYRTFRYRTQDMQTTGRYISFGVMPQGLYHFVDEIEVYKGDDAWLKQPAKGAVVPVMRDYLVQSLTTSGAQRRMNTDILDIRDSLAGTKFSASQKSTLSARLDKHVGAIEQMELLPVDFKTILPLNDIHRDILAVHGKALASQGFKPLTVWKQHRYARLPLLAKPLNRITPHLKFSMLRNQFRSDNLLLTNAGEKPQNITLRLNSVPRNATDGWLKIYSAVWTDTAESIPVADALLPLSPKNGAYVVAIPAGMTRKVWFTVDSSKVPAGAAGSTLVIDSVGGKTTVPFELEISKVAMTKPRFSLGMWDYTNGNGSGGINPRNRQDAIDLMRSHYVDTPWATGSALPLPVAADFDTQDNMQAKPDFSNFDHWVAMWPGARNYFVYLSVSDSFAGAKTNTPQFSARVGSWAKVLASHMKELGLQPRQLGFLLVDEPNTDVQDAIIVAWANAIKATAPEITLFEDPIWERPDQTTIQDAITKVDVLCVPMTIYKSGGAPVQEYFEKLRSQGKQLWFYQTSGPARLLDPEQYYRFQSWQAFAVKATGQGFWAFGDMGKAPTSWQSYGETGISYAPAFIDKETVYNSVHWEAVREGIQDYEELSMLRDAIATSRNAAWKNQAQQVLDNAVKSVTSTWNGNYDWATKSDSNVADGQLQKVRVMLASKGN